MVGEVDSGREVVLLYDGVQGGGGSCHGDGYGGQSCDHCEHCGDLLTCGSEPHSCDSEVQQTCDFVVQVPTCGSEVQTCEIEVLTYEIGVQTCGIEVLTCEIVDLTCGSEVQTCGFEKETCDSDLPCDLHPW